MKALTISQPLASLIADGEKWIENRTWPTPYRGELAIHAGKGLQYLDKDELAEYPNGCVVAVAKLVACVRFENIRYNVDYGNAKHRVPGTDKFWSELARHKHAEGPWCWVLENVAKLRTPIEWRGAQGLFDIPDRVFGIEPVNAD